MITDWVLFRRAAAELERELRGGRIVDAGLLDDGRFALQVAGRKGKPPVVLAVDPFGSPPLLALEPDAALALGGDPGWVRATATVVRGLRIGRVRSRPGDRVVVFDAGTTSRFGVTDGVRIVLELVPRFGNVLVLRERLVLAAAKQFSPAENEARSVSVGAAYLPPPLPEGPQLPRLCAESLAAEADRLPWPAPGPRADWIAARAAALLAAFAGETDALGPLHVYRDGGRLVAVHVVPLAQFAALEHSQAPALLPLLREAWHARDGRRTSDAVERRRTALARRLAKRRADIEAELASVSARRDDAAGRERLREAGDLLHTYGPLVPGGADRFVAPGDPPVAIALDPDLDAKANAAAYFARYRKATDALPHLERRLEVLAAKRDSLDSLAFESERADGTELLELTADLDGLEGRSRPRPAARRRARAPLRLERPSGARIYVGRSPRENVEVTFRIARPDDLWFHARGIPGSHVVLQAPPGAPADETDLDYAADLAARHSKARAAARVEIDFTERKYVRRQRDAAPGLVWYTNARTRVGRPDQVTE